MKLSDLALLSTPEETASAKAERQRRSKEIRAGRHPDTGRRLTTGDRKTLRPSDLFEFQMWKESRAMSRDWYLSELDRAAAKWREHQDLNNRIHALGSSLSDLSVIASQKLVGSTVGEQLRTAIELRNVDPLFRRSWETSAAGPQGLNLAVRTEQFRSSQLHEVDRAVTTQITAFWKDASDPLRYQPDRSVAAGWVQDAAIMEREATRMLGIYGRSLVDQSPFLTEYQSNLDLFRSQPLRDSVFQAADLLARVALPADLLPGFQFYEIQQVERLETFANAQLLELEEDFQRDGNPVHVWKAIDIALSAGFDLPTWVVAKISEVAERICEIGDREGPSGRFTEAELVGRAAGFAKGKGATGQFAGAKQLQRDREIYFEVEDWLSMERHRRADGGAKLSSAYAAVAEQYGVDDSTIQRAYQRIKSYVGTDE